MLLRPNTKTNTSTLVKTQTWCKFYARGSARRVRQSAIMGDGYDSQTLEISSFLLHPAAFRQRLFFRVTHSHLAFSQQLAMLKLLSLLYATQSVAADQSVFRLEKVSAAIAAQRNAYCLDGSLPCKPPAHAARAFCIICALTLSTFFRQHITTPRRRLAARTSLSST